MFSREYPHWYFPARVRTRHMVMLKRQLLLEVGVNTSRGEEDASQRVGRMHQGTKHLNSGGMLSNDGAAFKTE